MEAEILGRSLAVSVEQQQRIAQDFLAMPQHLVFVEAHQRASFARRLLTYCFNALSAAAIAL